MRNMNEQSSCKKRLKEAGVLLTVFVMMVSTMMVTAGDHALELSQANSVDISWSQPVNMLDTDWIHFDDGTNVNAIGLTNGGTFEFAIRITPAELAGYDGYELTVVRWHHGYGGGSPQPPHSGTIKIYDAGTSSSPGVLITSEPYTVPSTGWFEIPLTNPAPIVTSKDIWVSIQVTHAAGEYPAGVGPGPMIVGKGGWLSTDGVTWSQLTDYGLNYNWNIWAKVEEPSEPPETPQQPHGPSEGIIEVAYTFSTSTTDPENDSVSYLWDWDDGSPQEWTAYNDSGVTVYAFHGWASAGVYEIRVKAKDTHEEESDWSEPKTIHIVDSPILEVGNISGGLFRITAVVRNLGGVAATKVTWSITLDGGLILLGKETTGTILSLPAEEERTISSSPIIGFGKTLVTVTAACTDSTDTMEQEMFVFLFLIRIKQDDMRAGSLSFTTMNRELEIEKEL
jgi:hypothetical protein